MLKYILSNLGIEKFPDRLTLGLILTPILVVLVLLIIEYYGIQAAFYQHFADSQLYDGLTANQLSFAAQVHFSLSCILMMVVVPLLFHTIFPLSEHYCYYGFGIRSAAAHIRIYGMIILVMLPIVWVASKGESFSKFYPLYKPESYTAWLIFELVYMSQFFAIEFFFRGFALFRIERFAGLYAIVIMTIPYGLLHIHKPFPEAIGSIIAGCVLGYLAIKTRSIWPGFILHCSIAVSMDIFAMYHSGRIYSLTW